MRVAVATVAAAVLLFVWGAVSHVVLPLGTVGFRPIPPAREDTVLATLKAAIPEPGLYYYPWLDPAHTSDERITTAWEARARSGPAGLLLYHPTGERFVLQPVKLAWEAAGNLGCALLVTLVIARIRARAALRALVGPGFALFGWLSIQAPYWNFYGFPAELAMASLVTESVGGLLLGVVAARVVPPPSL